MLKSIDGALADIRAGLRMRRVWMALAREDIGDQHRRTTLGPLWLLVNYFAFTGAFIVVFGHNAAIPDFPSYAATGLFVWLYVSEIINLGVSLFRREESFIKGTTLPITVYAMRMTMQSLIRAAYALVGCLVIMVLEHTPVTELWLWSALGLGMIVLWTPAIILVCAFGGAFFPDMQFIVQNLMRLGMFVTPVFWTHISGDGLRTILYHWNPFTYFLDIVRAPIIFGHIPTHALLISGTIILATWATALLLLGRLRKQLVFII
jgi:lipopolysaccharide transport system permease protein